MMPEAGQLGNVRQHQASHSTMDKEALVNASHSDAQHPTQLVVGCALLPKKVQRYLTANMLQTAAQHNIQLKQIDYTQPLEPQGPFHLILHKLRPNPVWEQQLRQYVANHPSVVVVDQLDKIRQLHNRATMLRPLQREGILLQQQRGRVVRVQAPLQVEVAEGTTEAEAQAALAAAGLAPPLLCKPLWTDGRDGSHKLAVLHDLEALGRLLRGAVCSEFKPPLVVQQFVEHGGVLFKVYVLGEQTYVTARPSLGETELEPEHAVQQLPRISCVSVFSKQQQHMHHMQQPRAAAAPHTPAAAAGAAAATAEGAATPPAGPGQHTAAGSQGSHVQQQQSSAAAAVAAESVWQPPGRIVPPPAWLTSALAATLRQELGMSLFNFDLIVPEQQPGSSSSGSDGGARQQQQQPGGDDADAAPALCYVVDINFFPGVDKIPNFEQRFAQFLLAAAASGGHAATASPATQPAAEAEAAAMVREQQQQEQDGTTAAAAASAQGAAACNATQQQQQSTGCSAEQKLLHSSNSPGSDSGRSSSCDSGSRRSSNAGGSGGISSNSSARRLQHSLSADRGSVGVAAAVAVATTGAGAGSSRGQHSRRHSATGSGGSEGGGSRHNSGLDVGMSGGQWREGGVLGSSPPQTLQVAGCS